jgi:predicted AlkP superfamily phosphohydrolase/phosphomutase
MRRRVLAVALHGFGPYYAEPFLREGLLPAFAGVLDRGTSRPLLAPFPISAAAWVTLFTGQSAGVHGALDYVQVDARSYHGTHARLADTAAFADDTVFSILSRHGRRVAAVFLPMTYPPWPINGTMISGFPLPDERRPPTFPPELAQRLAPMAPRRLVRFRYEDRDAIEGYLNHLLARLEEVTLDLWRAGDYDLMCTCVPAPDLAHHYFWARDDPSAWDRMRRVYARVDRTLARYAAALGEGDTLVVFSDHGGGPAPSRMLSVTRWLAEAGLLRLRAPTLDRLGLVGATNRLVQLVRRFRLHQTLRLLLRGAVREGVLSLTHNDAFVDFGATRAYGVEFFYPLVGIEVNLVGRQSQGTVDARDEYEQVRSEVCSRLAALVDGTTGARVCRRVCRREELFHGPHLDRFPDIVAVLDGDYDGKVQLHRDVLADNALNWEYPFMGYHAQEGILAVTGPGVAAGRSLPAAHMQDLTPTLLRLLDVPVPATVEGAPLTDFGF